MSFATKAAAQVVAVLFLFSGSAVAEPEDSRQIRRPHSLAECLFREKPPAGAWASYSVQVDSSSMNKGGQATRPTRLIMRSAILPVEKDDQLEWFEVSIRQQPDKPPIYVAKLVVLRKPKTASNEWWLASQGVLGWEKRGNKIARFTENTVKNSAILAALITTGGSEAQWVDRSAIEIRTEAGRFHCNGFDLKSTSKDEPFRITCHLNRAVPFGLVRLEGALRFGKETHRLHIQLTGRGRRAKSDLPEKGLVGLVDD